MLFYIYGISLLIIDVVFLVYLMYKTGVLYKLLFGEKPPKRKR